MADDQFELESSMLEDTLFMEEDETKLKEQIIVSKLEDIHERILHITDLIFISYDHLRDYLRQQHGPEIEHRFQEEEEPWVITVHRDSNEYMESSIKETIIINVHEDISDLEGLVGRQARMLTNNFTINGILQKHTPSMLEKEAEDTPSTELDARSLKFLSKLHDIHSRMTHVSCLTEASNQLLRCYLRKEHGPGIEHQLEDTPWLYHIRRDPKEYAESNVLEQKIIKIHEDVSELERIVVYQHRIVYDNFILEEPTDVQNYDD